MFSGSLVPSSSAFSTASSMFSSSLSAISVTSSKAISSIGLSSVGCSSTISSTACSFASASTSATGSSIGSSAGFSWKSLKSNLAIPSSTFSSCSGLACSSTAATSTACSSFLSTISSTFSTFFFLAIIKYYKIVRLLCYLGSKALNPKPPPIISLPDDSKFLGGLSFFL